MRPAAAECVRKFGRKSCSGCGDTFFGIFAAECGRTLLSNIYNCNIHITQLNLAHNAYILPFFGGETPPSYGNSPSAFKPMRFVMPSIELSLSFLKKITFDFYCEFASIFAYNNLGKIIYCWKEKTLIIIQCQNKKMKKIEKQMRIAFKKKSFYLIKFIILTRLDSWKKKSFPTSIY